MLSRKRRNPKATHRDISLTAADTDGRTDQRARNARGMQMRLRLRRAAGGCIDRPHQAVGAAAQPIPAMGRVLYVVAVAGLPAGSVWSEPLGVNRKGEPLAGGATGRQVKLLAPDANSMSLPRASTASPRSERAVGSS